jgi:hypothetical protein
MAGAIQALVERSPVATAIIAVPDGRFPTAIEATAYFVVSEALANVAKHAMASGAEVTIRIALLSALSQPIQRALIAPWRIATARVAVRTASGKNAQWAPLLISSSARVKEGSARLCWAANKPAASASGTECGRAPGLPQLVS